MLGVLLRRAFASLTVPSPGSPNRFFRERVPYTSLLFAGGKVKDVASFLGTIKRGCEIYTNKFPTWESLFTTDSAAMRAAGIQCRQRKMILRWVHKYR